MYDCSHTFILKYYHYAFECIQCCNSSSHASLSSIVFKIECKNSLVPQITHITIVLNVAQGILNRSERRNNLVLIYDFYLMNLVSICIISHHSTYCAIHRSSQSSHYHCMTVKVRAFFQHCVISTRDINLRTWHGLVNCWTCILLRNGHSCQHVDTLITFSCWDIQGINLSPALPYISMKPWKKLYFKSIIKCFNRVKIDKWPDSPCTQFTHDRLLC